MHVLAQARKKILKSPTPKKSPVFQEMEFIGSNIINFQETQTPKKCLTFSQKKAFLIFQIK